MRTAILTLPLHTNYGGILQAYALRRVLMEMGHEVTVLDLEDKMPLPERWKAPAVYAKRALLRIVRGSAAPEVFRERRYRRELPAVSSRLEDFVRENVRPRVLGSYRDIREGEYDAFVVGSDQVWRPRYFGKIEDAFLGFAEDWKLRRIAYAASFGTDELEFSHEMLVRCAALLEKFDAVSVRESGAVDICDEWFCCGRAVHVLDPVMLLGADVYTSLFSGVCMHPAKGRVVTYILDSSPYKSNAAEFISRTFGMGIYDASVHPYDRDVPLEERIVPPLEEWLSCFADAGFVVTDSFHGCVLSILFHKPFIAVGNQLRGNSRISSLLDMFGLGQRLVHGIDPDDDGKFFMEGIDWDDVDRKLMAARKSSMDFLSGAFA
ncbi:MAG: polysaccharide pyruvyl transferase family protein [Bacteroidales bacterium]|nr:polysaccharide pyruvyl transferase family protein [Bacteroidales bacterium]